MRLKDIGRNGVATLGLIALLGVGGPACGDEARDDPERDVAAALGDLRDRVASGDLEGVCAGMSRAARNRAAEPLTGIGCAQGLRELLDPRRRVTRARGSGRRGIVRVKIADERAAVTITQTERASGRIRFVREGGEWKLDDLAVRPVWSEPTPEPLDGGGLEMRVWLRRGGHRQPCPALDYAIGKSVSGGCAFRVASDDAVVLMLTALGDFVVARCRAAYDLHIFDAGSTLVDDVEFAGPPPCDRIRHCKDGETGLRYPWQGEVQDDSEEAFVGSLDICANTPRGRIRGFFYTKLTKRDGDWRADPYDHPVGESPFQIGGRWDVEPDDLGLRDPEG